jgi:CheY-like chemotaxis protein
MPDNCNKEGLINFIQDMGCRVTWKDNYLDILTTLQATRQVNKPFSLIMLDSSILSDPAEQLAFFHNQPLLIMSNTPISDNFQQIKKPFHPKSIRKKLLEASGADAQNDGVQDESCQKQTFKGKINILLAEDNKINQKVALAILAKMGCEVEVANNGFEVLKKLEHHHYDLVLMDIQMPEMDGYTATSKIRDLSTPVLNHDIPIIAVTASAFKEDREHGLAVGMNDYMSKPIKPKELEAIVEKWIKHPDKKEEKMSEHPIVDWEFFNERFGDDEELVAELIEIYLEESPKQMQQVKDAIASGNMANLSLYAHSLKGASANMGAMEVRYVAADLEAKGKAKDATGLAELWDKLQQAFARATSEFKNPSNK